MTEKGKIEAMIAQLKKGLFGRIPWYRKQNQERQINIGIEIVRRHFDAEFYLSRNSDVALSGADPLRHFCQFGWREMRDPSPDFSIQYYLRENPDVQEQDINPFMHYLSLGKAQGRKGKLLEEEGFKAKDTDGRLDAERAVIEHAFDRGFYLRMNPDVSAHGWDPLAHYIQYGWKEGRDPAPYFSTAFYLETHSDVRHAGINPFWHFVVAGRAEGRAANREAQGQGGPHVLSGQSTFDDVALAIEQYFDAAYYLKKYPEVGDSGLHPLVHFCTQGWREGKNPSADFSVAGYLEFHPDVAASGVNPFWHYLVTGIGEGRSIASAEDPGPGRKAAAPSDGMKLIEAHFDSAFYVFQYRDVSERDIDPLEHYWSFGWKEGRDPSAMFSTSFYLETNPDVADLGINPFWHFVAAGMGEGRLPQHPGGYRVDRLRKLDTLAAEASRWAHRRVPEETIGWHELAAAILRSRTDTIHSLLLSVGHDHYRRISGGVQLCEYQEEVVSSLVGFSYLQVHPWQALPRLAHVQDEEDPLVWIVLNGEDFGPCRMSDVVQAVSASAPGFVDTQIVIHQLLGHLPERIVEIIHAAGRKDCWLWLHDFFTVCPSFTLQRNSVSYCGAPPMGSNACTLCRFGDERRSHAARTSSLFHSVAVHVLSPSQVTADLWSAQSGLMPASIRVVPHVTLAWHKRAKQLPKTSNPLTIAFLGTPAPHKGWNVFETLFRRLGNSEDYRFVFLGSGEVPARGIEYRRVHVTAEDPRAMITGVETEKIDLVLHWASWPETFSLSTYEAYAGGAYVITNGLSGNVAATVSRLGRGAVLTDERELQAFFEDGRAAAMVRTLRAERRRYEVRHQLSRMVYDAMDLPATLVRP